MIKQKYTLNISCSALSRASWPLKIPPKKENAMESRLLHFFIVYDRNLPFSMYLRRSTWYLNEGIHQCSGFPRKLLYREMAKNSSCVHSDRCVVVLWLTMNRRGSFEPSKPGSMTWECNLTLGRGRASLRPSPHEVTWCAHSAGLAQMARRVTCGSS